MPSEELKQTIQTIRNAYDRIISHTDYSFEYVTDYYRKWFFGTFSERFPKATYAVSGKDECRRIRLGIVMALLGDPIESMTDLPEQIWRLLIDVAKPNSRYLDEGLSRELEDAIAFNPFSNSWDILEWDAEKSPDMSDMPTDGIPF